MKKKKRFEKILLFVLLLVGVIILLFRHFRIEDFRIIEPETFYTSGQPRGMDYSRMLYNYHISTIVNVRLPAEHFERNWHSEELNWVKSHSVDYIEIPIERNNYFPDRQIQDKFLAIMADKNNLPLLLHGSGDDKRVAMLTAVWLRKSRKFTIEKTLKEIKKIIDDRDLTREEVNFISNLQK